MSSKEERFSEIMRGTSELTIVAIFILLGIMVIMFIFSFLIKIIKYPFKDRDKGYYEGNPIKTEE